MSVASVKAHVSRVLEKLELDKRVQIALLPHDAGEAQPRRALPPVCNIARAGCRLERGQLSHG